MNEPLFQKGDWVTQTRSKSFNDFLGLAIHCPKVFCINSIAVVGGEWAYFPSVHVSVSGQYENLLDFITVEHL